MKNRDLIAALQQIPPDLEVFCYNEGDEEFTALISVTIRQLYFSEGHGVAHRSGQTYPGRDFPRNNAIVLT